MLYNNNYSNSLPIHNYYDNNRVTIIIVLYIYYIINYYNYLINIYISFKGIMKIAYHTIQIVIVVYINPI